jgi:hypothetical protein
VILHTLIEGFPLDRLTGQFVTGDYFSAIGVNTVIDRPIVPADDATGAGAAVEVISYSIWQGCFGGRSEAIGKAIVIWICSRLDVPEWACFSLPWRRKTRERFIPQCPTTPAATPRIQKA